MRRHARDSEAPGAQGGLPATGPGQAGPCPAPSRSCSWGLGLPAPSETDTGGLVLSKKPPHKALLSARLCATPHVNGPKFLRRLPGHLERCAGTHRCPRSLGSVPSAPSLCPVFISQVGSLTHRGCLPWAPEPGTPPALQPPWAPLGSYYACSDHYSSADVA